MQSDLKIITAGNLIKLRTAAGLTQAELGEKLNYSDKTISKWERAEALPDASVLMRLGEIFDVSVDYLLTNHDAWISQEKQKPSTEYNHLVISLVLVLGVWILAGIIFVIFWILGSFFWSIFVAAIPLSLIAVLVMNSVWNNGRYNRLIVSGLVLSVFLLTYLLLYRFNPWQIFLLLPPSEGLVLLCFHIKRRKGEPSISSESKLPHS